MTWRYPGDAEEHNRRVMRRMSGNPTGWNPLTNEERDRMTKKRKGLGEAITDRANGLSLKVAEGDALAFEAEGVLNELEDRHRRQERRDAERRRDFDRYRQRSY